MPSRPAATAPTTRSPASTAAAGRARDLAGDRLQPVALDQHRLAVRRNGDALPRSADAKAEGLTGAAQGRKWSARSKRFKRMIAYCRSAAAPLERIRRARQDDAERLGHPCRRARHRHRPAAAGAEACWTRCALPAPRAMRAPLTAAELELMNLTGDGNGIDMVTMPQALRAQRADGEFLPAAGLRAQSGGAAHRRGGGAHRRDRGQDDKRRKIAGRSRHGGGVLAPHLITTDGSHSDSAGMKVTSISTANITP